MKTEEDEAFDELARRQGDWGGGFQAKRAMAADRFKDGIQWWMDTKTYGACPNPPQWHIDTGNLVRLVPAQPAQEPPSGWESIGAILDEYGLQAIDFVADFKAALAGREWNFCERCGKRTKDLTVIHTCTPPQEKNNG